MRRPWLPCLVATLVAASAPAATPVVQVKDFSEVEEHLIGERPVVRTPWQDRTRRSGGGGWFYRLTVDEQGRVARAVLRDGSASHRKEAAEAARAMRFKPFERDGRAVAVELDVYVAGQAGDYVGPADRAFAANVKPRDVRIALQRTECLGTCPDYWLEVRGDGWVTYRGEKHVAVPGEHRWRVDPAAVAALVERFRQADYLNLKGYYVANATDLPSYVTRLSLGSQQKFVLDYGGGGVGEAVASTSFGGPDPQMPHAVTELEEAIDAVAGSASFVAGDASTMDRLRKAGWNFRSKAAGSGLATLIGQCNTALATEFIRAGAPVNVGGQGTFESLPVNAAAGCGDAGLVRLLVAKGALARKKDAWHFLEAAVGSGYPEFVEIALKHASDLKHTTILFGAADTREPDEDKAGRTAFDPGRVVELLVAAGADPDARNRDGDTPLHQADSGAVARALIRAGADVNARGQYGWTPLFNKYWEEPKRVLVEAGADIHARDDDGDTALHHQFYASVAKVLIEGGLDVNARNNKGDTPLETATEQDIALALLAAGATPPTDPARLAALTAKATKKNWTALLQALSTKQP